MNANSLPPDQPGLEFFNENRTRHPPEDMLRYTNQCVAWTMDGTRIVTAGTTYVVARISTTQPTKQVAAGTQPVQTAPSQAQPTPTAPTATTPTTTPPLFSSGTRISSATMSIPATSSPMAMAASTAKFATSG